MRFWAVLIVGLGLSACSHTPDTLPEKPIQKQQVKLSQRSPLKISCTSAREYVTTLEYLRAHQELGVNESQARKIADQVSRGCSGSAKRFVSVLELLIKSHIAGRNALESAVALSQLDNEVIETFIFVFRQAYLKEYFDLSVSHALQLARSLSVEFDGSAKLVREDFDQLAEYCIEESGLDLPKPTCARIAAQVARMSAGYQESLAEPFIELLEFVRSKDGPERSTAEAIDVCMEAMKAGPIAARNYIQAFQYARSEQGMRLSSVDAMKFAKRIALRSEPIEPVPSPNQNRKLSESPAP